MTDTTTITVLYGHKVTKFKPPVLREKIIKRRFWFSKKEYYIDWEYCTLGPMTLEEAKYNLHIAKNV